MQSRPFSLPFSEATGSVTARIQAFLCRRLAPLRRFYDRHSRHLSISHSERHSFLALAMYVRVKRNKTTYFVQCDPTETILDIKQKLQVLIEQPVNNQRLTLVPTDEILDDSKTLAEQKVENDAVVALTLRKGHTSSN
ncbi:hypothetical protein Taro_048189 [Colocasia esculenta]|uniref:Ubiquitin-like domain-containing protein n=1 Tax=Colocasia esculenta TaxID=4460 RepID=A0A843X2D9_COLES|nr:hypothetical protein [Colocasia esculenta]